MTANATQKSNGTRMLITGLVRLGFTILIIGAVLFGISGHWDWLMAWFYIGVWSVLAIVTVIAIGPELREERATAILKFESWDRVIGLFIGLGYFGTLIVAALDARYGWSAWVVSLAPQVAGLVVMVLGLLLGIWAMLTNKYFSSAVRIQEDRGQAVVTGGPYRFVRHPSYTGYILYSLVTPLILSSLWAFIPTGFLACSIIARTAFEDKALLENLEGYREYTRQTRYRLLPGVW